MSGLATSDIQKLASIGGYGRKPSRCNKDIMDKFSLKEESAPPVDIIKAPARDKNNEVVWVDCAVMFPHRVFAQYSHVFGNPEQIQEW